MLSEREFEPLAAHLVRLNRHRQSKDYSPPFVTLHRIRSVTWVRLIRERWLVVAETDQLSSVLSIWEIKHLLASGKGPGKPIYEAYLDGPVVDGLLDFQGGAAVMALELRPALSVPLYDVMVYYANMLYFVKTTGD